MTLTTGLAVSSRSWWRLAALLRGVTVSGCGTEASVAGHGDLLSAVGSAELVAG